MDKFRLRIFTFWAILTKMPFLATCVANLVLDVVNNICLVYGSLMIIKFCLGLQKTFVELDIRFTSENR